MPAEGGANKPPSHPAVLPPGAVRPPLEGETVDDHSAQDVGKKIFAREAESAGLWIDNQTGLAIVGIGMNMKRPKSEVAAVLKRAGFMLHHDGDPRKMARSLGWHISRRRNAIRIATKQATPGLRVGVARAYVEATEEAYRRLQHRIRDAVLPRKKTTASIPQATEITPTVPVRRSERDMRFDRPFEWPNEYRFAYYMESGARTSGTLTPQEYLETYRTERFLWQRKNETRPETYPDPRDVQDYLTSLR